MLDLRILVAVYYAEQRGEDVQRQRSPRRRRSGAVTKAFGRAVLRLHNSGDLDASVTESGSGEVTYAGVHGITAKGTERVLDELARRGDEKGDPLDVDSWRSP